MAWTIFRRHLVLPFKNHTKMSSFPMVWLLNSQRYCFSSTLLKLQHLNTNLQNVWYANDSWFQRSVLDPHSTILGSQGICVAILFITKMSYAQTWVWVNIYWNERYKGWIKKWWFIGDSGVCYSDPLFTVSQLCTLVITNFLNRLHI